jgi:hypothetical protein
MSFKENFTKFLSQLEKFVDYGNPLDIANSIGKKKGQNVAQVQLKRYSDAWGRRKEGDEDIHKEFYKIMYTRHRDNILKGLNSDVWMKDDAVKIILGDGKVNPSTKTIIRLSAIYRKACDISDRKESEIDVDDGDDGDYQELIYPKIFMLYFYRLCVDVEDVGKDKEKLQTYVKSIEDDLGIAPDKEINVSTSPMSGIAGMMGGLISQLGGKDGMKNIQESLGKKGINSSNPQDLMKQFFSPEMAQKFGGAFEGVKNAKNMEEAMSGVMSGLTDTMKGLKSVEEDNVIPGEMVIDAPSADGASEDASSILDSISQLNDTAPLITPSAPLITPSAPLVVPNFLEN